MIDKSYIEKYEKILSYFKLDKCDVFDIVKAISFAESYGTHPIKLKDLAVSGVVYFSDIVSDTKDAEPLPDTRVMRVLADSITVIVYSTHNSIFSRTEYASALTSLSDNTALVLRKVVEYTEPFNRGRIVTGASQYKTVEECKKILDLYFDLVSDIDKDYGEFFEYVSKTLGRFKTLFSRVDKNNKYLAELAKTVYLPDKFDSHGLEVMTTLPKSLKLVTKSNLGTQIEIWDLSKFMDIFIKSLVGTKSGDFYRDIFISKLIRITNTMSDITPIGVAVSTGAREPLYCPESFLKNQTTRNLYGNIFSDSVALTTQSIDSMFEVYYRLYNLKEEM